MGLKLFDKQIKLLLKKRLLMLKLITLLMLSAWTGMLHLGL